jgi:hypothetical protein
MHREGNYDYEEETQRPELIDSVRLEIETFREVEKLLSLLRFHDNPLSF